MPVLRATEIGKRFSRVTSISFPTDALAYIGELFVEDDLARLFLRTFAMTLAVALCAIAVGIPLGLLLVRFDLLPKAGCAAFSAPLVLLYPLFLVILGRGPATRHTPRCWRTPRAP